MKENKTTSLEFFTQWKNKQKIVKITKSETRTFSDINKLKYYITSRPALQKVLKESFTSIENYANWKSGSKQRKTKWRALEIPTTWANILFFSCCCNKLAQLQGLTQYIFILQFCKSGVQHRSHWAKNQDVSRSAFLSGASRKESISWSFPVSRGHLHFLVMNLFFPL